MVCYVKTRHGRDCVETGARFWILGSVDTDNIVVDPEDWEVMQEGLGEGDIGVGG